MYKQQKVFIYSIESFSLYSELASSTPWKEELNANIPGLSRLIKNIQQTQTFTIIYVNAIVKNIKTIVFKLC